MKVRRPLFRAILLAVFVVGCGGSPRPAASIGAAADAAPDEPSPPALTENARRLQGTWEVVHFQTKHPVPEEARPLFGRMFESLHLRFERGVLSVDLGNAHDKYPYAVTDDTGDIFRLRVKSGIFDGSFGRFVDDDTLELVDEGATWPGVSRLRRLR